MRNLVAVWDTSTPRVEVAEGVWSFERLTITGLLDNCDLAIEVKAISRRADQIGRLEVIKLVLSQLEGGPSVELPARLPIASLLAAVSAFMPSEGPGVWLGGPPSDDELRGMAAAGPTPEVLRWVAFTYRAALVNRGNPTVAVESAFGLARSTAGRWIAKARQDGFLAAAERPGKAGG